VFHLARAVTSLHGFSLFRVLSASWTLRVRLADHDTAVDLTERLAPRERILL
jgi:hypothetical protein